jgi:hypothetical protein
VSALGAINSHLQALDRKPRPSGAEAASALKAFSERLDATFIYAGIDLLTSDLFAGHMGRQIKARMIVHEMSPYGYGSQVQRDEWTELVLGLEGLLPLAKHREGSLEEHATYLYDRTGGSIGTGAPFTVENVCDLSGVGKTFIYDKRRPDLTRVVLEAQDASQVEDINYEQQQIEDNTASWRERAHNAEALAQSLRSIVKDRDARITDLIGQLYDPEGTHSQTKTPRFANWLLRSMPTCSSCRTRTTRSGDL